MSLIQIGEAASKYGISRRSLRYWEEKGILESARGENGYRMYDEANLAKISQIMLLREISLPLQDIYTIFISENRDEICTILEKHLLKVKRDVNDLSSLVTIIAKLIEKVRHGGKSSMFMPVDVSSDDPYHEIKQSFLNLSERSKEMENEIRIVNLPKMTFASYRAESETPEDDCTAVMHKFITENGIKDMQGFRHFGFNNPDPSEGNPVYGYEMWAVVPKDYEVPSPLWKKEFGGGLFASLTCTLANIGERWHKLHTAMMQSEKYEIEYDETRDRIGLEENINYDAFNTPGAKLSDMQLDLFMPIKAK